MIPSIAQSIPFDSLAARAERTLDAAQYDSALYYGTAMRRTILDTSSEQAGRTAIFFAKYYLENSNLDAVSIELSRGIKIFRSLGDSVAIAELYNLEGELALKYTNYGLAYTAYTQSLNLRLTHLGELHEKVADSYNNLGNLYYRLGFIDTAIRSHLEALRIRQQILTPPHVDLASSLNNLAACYMRQEKFELAIEYNQQALEQRVQVLGPDHPKVADSYNNLGNCYFRSNNIEAALNSHQQALQIRKTRNLTGALAQTYNNIGNCLAARGEHSEALKYYFEALSIRQQYFSDQPRALAQIMVNVGSALLASGDYERAQDRFNEALFTLQLGNPPDSLLLADLYLNLGRCYTFGQDYDFAERSFERARFIYTRFFGPDHPPIASCWNNLGIVQFERKAYRSSEASYREALRILQAAPEKNYFSIASCLNNLGNCAYRQNQWQEAGEWYRQAWNLLQQKDIRRLDLQLSIQRNLATLANQQGQPQQAIALLEAQKEEVSQYGFPPSIDLINLIGTLAESYYLQYQTVHRPELLQQALSNYEKAAELIDQLITRYRSQASKRLLINFNFTIYEKAIQCAHRLQQLPGYGQEVLRRAFVLSERSKAILVRQGLNEARAEAFARIPDSLLALEKRLSDQLAYFEKQRYEEADRMDSSQINALDFRILQIKKDYNELISQFETNNPDYYQLKYDLDPVSVQELQASIRQDGPAIISYFVGDSTIFAFIIKKDALQLVQLPTSDIIASQVTQLWDGISNFTAAQGADQYKTYAQNYVKNSTSLYEQLILPLEKAANLPQNLIIIPDGILCFIPFDLLLTNAPDSSQLFRFQQYDYLIRKYQFSYNYSVTLWHKLITAPKSRTKAKYGFGAFAPYFPVGRTQLRPLFYNLEEVQAIDAIIRGGQVFRNEEATVENFQKNAPLFRVLHLATHGEANAIESDFSFLAFTPGKDSIDQLLYTRTIYNLPLQAVDMVVLSACETGLGESQRGEGIISLAQAFAYAGAGSIITTLWSIDDQKTAVIMKHFYTYLKSGRPKDEALRLAKLDYINEYTSENAHPFFWAAFIPLGNMEPVQLNDFDNRWLFLIGAAFMVLVMALLHFFRKRTC